MIMLPVWELGFLFEAKEASEKAKKSKVINRDWLNDNGGAAVLLGFV